jgi:regulator of replication initiation timing
MDTDLAGLEQKLATLLADYHRLRAENESLKRELGRAMEHNRSLNSRIAAATSRLDSLLQQLPESTG